VRPASHSIVAEDEEDDTTTRRRTRKPATWTPRSARRAGAILVVLALATPAIARRSRALVFATDFESGQLSTVAMAAPHRVRRLATDVFSDAVLRTTGGLTIVLNRFLADNVQLLGPKLRTRLQCGTGPGSNPHDVVVLDPGKRGATPGKAYVTRYGARELWIVDPAARGCRRFHTGSVDLGPYADGDGIPEMDQAALAGSRLFVTVQRLDRDRGFVPTAYSSVVAVDTTTDAPIAAIRLIGRNAFGDASGIAHEPGGTRLAISTPGDLYTIGDGGIEWIDPDALSADPAGFFVTEDDVDGNVTDFVLVSASKAYAVVQARDLKNRLVAFDPSHAAGSVTTIFSRDGFVPDIALAPDGMLWIADQARPSFGVRILDPATDEFVTTRPIDVGLPPFSLGFLP
jgi:hypothetical protein